MARMRFLVNNLLASKDFQTAKEVHELLETITNYKLVMASECSRDGGKVSIVEVLQGFGHSDLCDLNMVKLLTSLQSRHSENRWILSFYKNRPLY